MIPLLLNLGTRTHMGRGRTKLYEITAASAIKMSQVWLNPMQPMLSAPFYPASFSFFFLNPHNFIRADGYMFYINAFWKVCCPPIINLSLITLLTFHTPRFLLRKRCSSFPFWQTLLGAESSSKTNWACVHWITPVKVTRFVLTNQQHRIKKEKFGIRLSCFLQAKEFIILIR